MNFREELGKISPKINSGANIYAFGCGSYFEYLRTLYKHFAGINLEDYISAFIDNDNNKQGLCFYGKKTVNVDSVNPDNTVVLITAINYSDYSIDGQMMDRGFLWGYDLHDNSTGYSILKSWIFSKIITFKNKHKGERCFIIGGGASLTVGDLETIKNEHTIAMNRIYRIFNKTKWRPTYYITGDQQMYAHSNEIFEYVKCPKFFAFNHCEQEVIKNKSFHIENTYFYTVEYRAHNRPAEFKKPEFGINPDLFVSGGTTAYLCLQLAVLMGFKEIYLLGIDNEYSIMKKNSGEIICSQKQDHFAKEYYSENFMDKYKNRGFLLLNIDLVTAAYESAREYAENHGITIKNATRGGKLEVFERIDLKNI